MNVIFFLSLVVITSLHHLFASDSLFRHYSLHLRSQADKYECKELEDMTNIFCRNLPKEIKKKIVNLVLNEIICQEWNKLDNEQTFEQHLLAWKNYDALQSNKTSVYEQWRDGYWGIKKPIYFYTLKNGKPTIKEVGTVLNFAVSSYEVSSRTMTKLILNSPTKTYTVTITLNDSGSLTHV